MLSTRREERKMRQEVREPNVLLPSSQPARSVKTGLGAGSAVEQYRRLHYAIGASDGLAFVVAIVGAYFIRFDLRKPPTSFQFLMVASPFILLAVFSALQLYGVQRMTPAEEVRRIIGGISVTMTIIVTVSFWSKAPFGRKWVGLTWLFSTVLILITRRAWHRWMGRARKRGKLTFRTLILGTNEEGERLGHVLSNSAVGFRPLGFVSADRRTGQLGGLPILGEVEDLQRLVAETGADCVFVASTAVRSEQMSQVAKVVRNQDIAVRVSANLPELLSSRLTVQPIGGVMALSLKAARLTGPQAVAKRIFDVVVAFASIVVTAPLWLGIAVAIKLTSRGPVLHRQERIGRRGEPFTFLKFRSMVVGAEALLPSLLDRNEASGPLFKLRGDPRVTRVGRWLRKWSLDELPQLISVLRGDMSMVGPRPPLPDEVAAYEDWHRDRLEVPPGITGLWQVSGRSDLSFDEYVRLDIFYVENWSLAYDFFILMKTLPVLMSRRGAY
jgi:exopolysaccharide biosynthesis polyprenyl glycosylphosphotransferase